MNNFEAIEKLTESFLMFIDRIKLSNDMKQEWLKLQQLQTPMKILFIKSFIAPYKDNLDKLINELVTRYNQKIEDFNPEDVSTLKKYFKCYIECSE